MRFVRKPGRQVRQVRRARVPPLSRSGREPRADNVWSSAVSVGAMIFLLHQSSPVLFCTASSSPISTIVPCFPYAAPTAIFETVDSSAGPCGESNGAGIRASVPAVSKGTGTQRRLRNASPLAWSAGQADIRAGREEEPRNNCEEPFQTDRLGEHPNRLFSASLSLAFCWQAASCCYQLALGQYGQ